MYCVSPHKIKFFSFPANYKTHISKTTLVLFASELRHDTTSYY